MLAYCCRKMSTKFVQNAKIPTSSLNLEQFKQKCHHIKLQVFSVIFKPDISQTQTLNNQNPIDGVLNYLKLFRLDFFWGMFMLVRQRMRKCEIFSLIFSISTVDTNFTICFIKQHQKYVYDFPFKSR